MLQKVYGVFYSHRKPRTKVKVTPCHFYLNGLYLMTITHY